MNRKVLWVFTIFTVISVILLGRIVYIQVFETSANTMLLGTLALFSVFCGVLVLWIGLSFEDVALGEEEMER